MLVVDKAKQAWWDTAMEVQQSLCDLEMQALCIYAQVYLWSRLRNRWWSLLKERKNLIKISLKIEVWLNPCSQDETRESKKIKDQPREITTHPPPSRSTSGLSTLLALRGCTVFLSVFTYSLSFLYTAEELKFSKAFCFFLGPKKEWRICEPVLFVLFGLRGRGISAWKNG